MCPAPGTLRVSVLGGHDRVDLVVPAAVSVAELLPALAGRLGALDPLSAPGEVRLSVLGGPPLDPAGGLAGQGVVEGAVLTVTAADHPTPDRVDDDLARVVADAVESVPRPASGAVRRAGLAVAAGLLGAAGVGALVTATPAAAAVSGATAVALLGAVALARRDGSLLPVVAAWLAVTHAAVAGLAAGPVGAGAACVVAGVVAAVATRRGSTLWAAPVAGAVLCAVGSVAAAAPAPLGMVATFALVAVVVTGDLHPWLAAMVAGLAPPPLGEETPTAPDRDAVSDAVRRAHVVLLVSTLATGLLLAALGPVVAGGGAWGVALVGLCCAVVGLRSRRHRVGPSGLVGVLAATASLVSLAAALSAQRPEWRLGVVACVAGVGLLALVAVAVPAPRGARAGRGAELLEALALVALPPVALAATGLLGLVRELVG